MICASSLRCSLSKKEATLLKKMLTNSNKMYKKQLLKQKSFIEERRIKDQKKNELRAYLTDKGYAGFENMGCYKCNGYKLDCPAYLPQKDLN